MIMNTPSLETNVSLRRYTTLKLGGPAEAFFQPETIDELMLGIHYFHDHNMPITLLGDGSNVLIHDDGIPGVVIVLKQGEFLRERFEDGLLHLGAGLKTMKAAEIAKRYQLSGFEYLVGFPGTIGGAVFGNAGNKDEFIGKHIRSLSLVTFTGERFTRSLGPGDFSYRALNDRKGFIIVEASFSLTEGNMTDIEAKMEGVRELRRNKDPKGIL